MIVVPARAARRHRLRRQLINEFQIVPEHVDSIGHDVRRRTALKIIVPFTLVNVIVVTSASVLMGLNWNNIPAIRGYGLVVFTISRMILVIGSFFIYFRLLMFPLMDRLCRRDLLAVLREHGYNICPNCGYRWDGLPGSMIECPECGAKAGRVEPRMNTDGR